MTNEELDAHWGAVCRDIEKIIDERVAGLRAENARLTGRLKSTRSKLRARAEWPTLGPDIFNPLP